MNEIILEGQIKVIYDTQVITDSFKKKEFVLVTDEKYPQEIKIETVNDVIEKLEVFKVGDSIKASVNIRGRSWTNKENKDVYFVSVNAWRLEAVKGASGDNSSSMPPAGGSPDDSFADDLPF